MDAEDEQMEENSPVEVTDGDAKKRFEVKKVLLFEA